MFEPKNEQGTIVYFQRVGQQLGYELVSIQSSYPDAVIHDINNGKDLRVEFEYNSNNFKAHKHDPKGCDLVICWKRGGVRLELPILELSTMQTHQPMPCESAPRISIPEPLKESPKPTKLTNRGKWNSIILTYEKHLHLDERKDGSMIRGIIICPDGNRGDFIEATPDDTRKSSQLLRYAVEYGKEVRGGSDDYFIDTPAGRDVGKLVIFAFLMRLREEHPVQ